MSHFNAINDHSVAAVSLDGVFIVLIYINGVLFAFFLLLLGHACVLSASTTYLQTLAPEASQPLGPGGDIEYCRAMSPRG